MNYHGREDMITSNEKASSWETIVETGTIDGVNDLTTPHQ